MEYVLYIGFLARDVVRERSAGRALASGQYVPMSMQQLTALRYLLSAFGHGDVGIATTRRRAAHGPRLESLTRALCRASVGDAAFEGEVGASPLVAGRVDGRARTTGSRLSWERGVSVCGAGCIGIVGRPRRAQRRVGCGAQAWGVLPTRSP